MFAAFDMGHSGGKSFKQRSTLGRDMAATERRCGSTFEEVTGQARVDDAPDVYESPLARIA